MQTNASAPEYEGHKWRFANAYNRARGKHVAKEGKKDHPAQIQHQAHGAALARDRWRDERYQRERSVDRSARSLERGEGSCQVRQGSAGGGGASNGQSGAQRRSVGSTTDRRCSRDHCARNGRGSDLRDERGYQGGASGSRGGKRGGKVCHQGGEGNQERSSQACPIGRQSGDPKTPRRGPQRGHTKAPGCAAQVVTVAGDDLLRQSSAP